jgi:hypothetical protein
MRKFEMDKVRRVTSVGQPVGITEKVLQIAVVSGQQARACILHGKRTGVHNSMAVIRPDP